MSGLLQHKKKQKKKKYIMTIKSFSRRLRRVRDSDWVWPSCRQRTSARVSQSRPSLYWMIWIFCSSLSRPTAGSHRKDLCSCCFWRHLRTKCWLILIFILCCPCLAESSFRFKKINKDKKQTLTGPILILSAFGFLARLTVVDSVVLIDKWHDLIITNISTMSLLLLPLPLIWKLNLKKIHFT